MVCEVHVGAVDMVGEERAAHATHPPTGTEHEVIDDQLAASVEELKIDRRMNFEIGRIAPEIYHLTDVLTAVMIGEHMAARIRAGGAGSVTA